MFFAYRMSKLIYLKYFEIYKIATILGFGSVFKPEDVTEFESNIKIGHAIPYILRFCSTF